MAISFDGEETISQKALMHKTKALLLTVQSEIRKGLNARDDKKVWLCCKVLEDVFHTWRVIVKDGFGSEYHISHAGELDGLSVPLILIYYENELMGTVELKDGELFVAVYTALEIPTKHGFKRIPRRTETPLRVLLEMLLPPQHEFNEWFLGRLEKAIMEIS